jgi:hypothetical protein
VILKGWCSEEISNADRYNGNKIIITYVTSRAATIMKVRENIHQQIGRRWSLPLTYLSKIPSK